MSIAFVNRGRRRSANPGSSEARAGRRFPVSVVLAVVVVAIVVLWALIPAAFATHDPIAGSAASALQAPSAQHWFGTDATGRDLYSRVVYGASESLLGAVIAVAVGGGIGVAVGVIAGSATRSVSTLLMRFVDTLLAVPQLLVMLAIIVVLGFGTTNAAIAVGVTSVAIFARVTRAEVLSVRQSEYVEAARASGALWPAVLVRHIAPNALTPVVALAAIELGKAILALSTLGFLGYGAPPPTPEWGLLIAEGRNYVATSWWLTTIPGIVVVAVVVSANRLSSWVAARSTS